jgi:hypothetical protein
MPISAFTMVSGAVAGVRSLCNLVKEAQAAGKEVANITSQVTGFVSQVLEGTDKLQKAEQEARTNPPKGKSLQVLAFEEVARKLELKNQYEELRNMIIYELGLPGGFWADFQTTLERMEKEDKEAKELMLLQHKQEALAKEKRKKALHSYLGQWLATILIVLYMAILIWTINLHNKNQLNIWLG